MLYRQHSGQWSPLPTAERRVGTRINSYMYFIVLTMCCVHCVHNLRKLYPSKDLHILNLKWIHLPAQQLKSPFHVSYFLLMMCKKLELAADQTRWTILLPSLCCTCGLVDENTNMHTFELNLSNCPLFLSEFLVYVLPECSSWQVMFANRRFLLHMLSLKC